MVRKSLRFTIEDAWMSKLLGDAAGKALIWVKNVTDFLRFCYLNILCLRMNITLSFLSSSGDIFTLLLKNSTPDVSVGFRPPHLCHSKEHQHGVSIQSFENFGKTFSEYRNVNDPGQLKKDLYGYCGYIGAWGCLYLLTNLHQQADFTTWTFFILLFLDMPTNNGNYIISQIYFFWCHHSSSLWRGHNWCIRVFRNSVKVKISCISKIIIAGDKRSPQS